MGWAITPIKGTVFLCKNDDCGHEDCQGHRDVIETKCEICDKPIGEDGAYYREASGYAHRLCVWKREELSEPQPPTGSRTT